MPCESTDPVVRCRRYAQCAWCLGLIPAVSSERMSLLARIRRLLS